MDMDVWRIECPDGLGYSTTVSYNGKSVNVRSVSLRIEGGDVVIATIEVENVEVAIGGLRQDTPGSDG